jgi:hypothetical protein
VVSPNNAHVEWLRIDLEHVQTEHARLTTDPSSDHFGLLALEIRAEALKRQIDDASTRNGRDTQTRRPRWEPSDRPILVSGG